MINSLIQMFKVLFVSGVLGLAAVAGYRFGTWEQDRLLLTVREQASSEAFKQAQIDQDALILRTKEEAFQSGKKEGQKELRQQLDDRLQDKADLAYLIGITKDPQIYNRLPADGQAIVDRSALSATEQGIQIPQLVLPAEDVGSPICIGLNQVVLLRQNEVFDQCETQSQIAFVSFVKYRTPGLANFKIDGDSEQASPGETISISNACWLTYMRMEEEDEILQPAVRFQCK